jgi:uncharacterized protein
MEIKLNKVKKYVKSILMFETTGHDFYHAKRVMNNAVQISKNMDIDLNIVRIAALTHDLIDKKVTSDIMKSINDLEKTLFEIGYPNNDVVTVIHIIKNISYSKGSIPDSLEGKIVQDADRLDAIGAIGIARTFAYGGKNNRMIYNPESKDGLDSVSHFYDKLLKLKDLMNTKEARKIAEKRTTYMVDFLNKFYLEWEGKDL